MISHKATLLPPPAGALTTYSYKLRHRPGCTAPPGYGYVDVNCCINCCRRTNTVMLSIKSTTWL